jgi:hypothetical protein
MGHYSKYVSCHFTLRYSYFEVEEIKTTFKKLLLNLKVMLYKREIASHLEMFGRKIYIVLEV